MSSVPPWPCPRQCAVELFMFRDPTPRPTSGVRPGPGCQGPLPRRHSPYLVNIQASFPAIEFYLLVQGMFSLSAHVPVPVSFPAPAEIWTPPSVL